MKNKSILIIGFGHLAYRLKKLAVDDGCAVIHLPHNVFDERHGGGSRFDAIAHALEGVDLSSLARIFLVDDEDQRNLELVIAFASLNEKVPITVAFSNENIAPHLKIALPNITVLNPARLAAPTFIGGLDSPVSRALSYALPKFQKGKKVRSQFDSFIVSLVTLFAALVVSSTVYFHAADGFSWINSVYFVVVTVATVGYGDINLLNASFLSKVVDIFLIIASMFFIWMIFSLTVDRIIKKRTNLSLGRKKYSYKNHVIVCGLGRLGYFVAEGLVARGEKVIIVEKNENSIAVPHFRELGVSVYVGDARSVQVLQDIGIDRAKAIFSVISDDYANLEIGLNARSLNPGLLLVLRIFDESIAQRVKEKLDIHLTFSMSAIVDELFFKTLSVNDDA